MMRASLVLVASVLVAGAVAQSCLPVGFGDYNVQAFTSYTGRNSDVEGSLFAGAFDLINYSVHSVASCPGSISLKANTGSWTNGMLKNGAGILERAGAVTLSSVGVGANNVAAFNVPAVPAAVSAQLCALADDATVLQNSPYTGAVAITTGNAGFSVASVSLSQITQVSINRANADDTVVINLRSATGAVEFLNSMIMIDGNANNDVNAPYIIFNACGVSDISIHSYGFWGSLLAPSSALTFYNGQFNGQVIVDTVDGLNGQYGEFHCIPFNGCVCPDGQCPNDPQCTSNCDLLDTECDDYSCVQGNCEITSSTSCDDSDLCNPQVCDDALGCILDMANAVTCPADTACTEYTCNAATGVCESADIGECNNSDLCNPQVCDDNLGCIAGTPVTCPADTACTEYTCNSATGACESTDISMCDDSDLCNPQVCDDNLGCILDTPNVVTCQDTFCFDYECVPALGTCEVQSSTVCDDSNPCTDDVCNDSTGACAFTPNGQCGECVLEFGDEANFNVYSKSFLTLNSDVEGPIAAAGKITANAFGVNFGTNDFVCDIGSSSRALVTAANAQLSNGQVVGGVVVGTGCTGTACGAFTTTTMSPPNINAPAIMSNLQTINAVLCAQPTITTADFKVMNVNTAGNLGSQNIAVAAGQTVVINVHVATGFVNGQHTVNGQVANTFQAGQAGGRLLWNVCHSNPISITNFAFGGALLAPNSAVTAASASADGQLFTGSYTATNGGQAHCMKFTGCLCPYGVCTF